ncbi:hypothetical protein M1523_04070 [Patescibacteria group bacterium]|nr:hypothetical protein [Patescibacteria group bacterium]MCL5091868.1 hypothetical protein [Patescibacteria group bacterium]
MKKKYINLFGKSRFIRVNNFNYWLRVIITVFGVTMFAGFIIVNLLQIKQQNDLKSLEEEKSQLLNELIADKDNEAKLNYFEVKSGQLNTFTKDDTQFVPYYKALNETLSQASDSSYLDSITIDKNKNTKFSVKLVDFNSLMGFIRYVESDKFKNQFSSLVLTSFSLSDTDKRDYQLTFSGQFK